MKEGRKVVLCECYNSGEGIGGVAAPVRSLSVLTQPTTIYRLCIQCYHATFLVSISLLQSQTTSNKRGHQAAYIDTYRSWELIAAIGPLQNSWFRTL